MVEGGAGKIIEWVRPHVPESSDGILTSAGICEGFAGAGVGLSVLIFAGFAGLVIAVVCALDLDRRTFGNLFGDFLK